MPFKSCSQCLDAPYVAAEGASRDDPIRYTPRQRDMRAVDLSPLAFAWGRALSAAVNEVLGHEDELLVVEQGVQVDFYRSKPEHSLFVATLAWSSETEEIRIMADHLWTTWRDNLRAPATHAAVTALDAMVKRGTG